MVIEIPARGVIAKSDVDAQLGPGEGVAVAGPHDLDRVAQQTQRGDGEDLVGMKGTVVGRDQHPATL